MVESTGVPAVAGPLESRDDPKEIGIYKMETVEMEGPGRQHVLSPRVQQEGEGGIPPV